MNWQQPKKLALALRDQGLADCLAARLQLSADFPVLVVGKRHISVAHVAVAKFQQAVEKVTKGFLLWHSGSFDPTVGHTPFTDGLQSDPHANTHLQHLSWTLNRLNAHVVREIKWLESLAPRPPEVSKAKRGRRIALEQIRENSEYTFWSPAKRDLVIAAEGLTLRDHGVRAAKCVRVYLEALAQSDPAGFTGDIRSFLEDYPFNVGVGSRTSA